MVLPQLTAGIRLEGAGAVEFDGVSVAYEYGGHSFQPAPLPPLLKDAMARVSAQAGAGASAGAGAGADAGAGPRGEGEEGAGDFEYNAVNVNVYEGQEAALARHRCGAPRHASVAVGAGGGASSPQLRCPSPCIVATWYIFGRR